MLSVLGNRNFTLLWIGLLGSSVGDWINYVAMAALVYQQTRSALALAILRLFHIVPILLIAPVAGVFVDRWSRKLVLVVTPLIAAVAAVALAFLHPVAMVFFVYGAITIALIFFNPARTATIPNIVTADELVPANSLTQITSTASIVLGGLMGGIIVTQLGFAAAFLLNGVSFLLVGGCAAFVRVPATRHLVTGSSFREEVIEGVAYLWRHAIVGLVVVAGALFVFAEATVLTLGIAFVRASLHRGSEGYAEILVGFGVGSVLGAAWMMAYRNRLRHDRVFALSGVVSGIGVAGLGLSHAVLPAAVAYGVSGFGSVASTVSGVTLLQRLVPDQVRGRIFSVATTFDHLGAFLSTIGIGAGAGILSVAGLITASGVAAAFAGGITLLFVLTVRTLVPLSWSVSAEGKKSD
jgi:MFS family permease